MIALPIQETQPSLWDRFHKAVRCMFRARCGAGAIEKNPLKIPLLTNDVSTPQGAGGGSREELAAAVDPAGELR
jgi:hypothetical protein